MNILVKLYDLTLRLAGHRNSSKYLAAVSFVESSFFPIPPDVMLCPMALAKPERATQYAFIATMFSVIGGVFGYLLGYYLFEAIVTPWMVSFGYYAKYLVVVDWFARYGFWALLIAGFTPIPYKLFTIGAGAAKFSFPIFFLASIIGRSSRFFLVAFCIKMGGEKMEKTIRKMVDKIGWAMLFIIGVIFVWHKFY